MPLPTSHVFIVPSSPTSGHTTLELDGLIHGEHATRWMLLTNGLGIAAFFAAPYIYIYWSAGQAMPTTVVLIVTCLILLLASVGRIRKVVVAISRPRHQTADGSA
jgi:hypothetical protein